MEILIVLMVPYFEYDYEIIYIKHLWPRGQWLGQALFAGGQLTRSSLERKTKYAYESGYPTTNRINFKAQFIPSFIKRARKSCIESKF